MGVVLPLAFAWHRRTHPDLTEAMVVEELGEDELALSFFTEPDDPWAERMPCESKPGLHSVDEGRDAAQAAGWIERICRGDPDRMRLTEDGRARSKRWRTNTSPPGDHAYRGWWLTVARYERTGRPRIGPRESEEVGQGMIPAHDVVIPGHWVPNEDGRRLHDTGWPRIRVVDREERYTFWEGWWARRHGGS